VALSLGKPYHAGLVQSLAQAAWLPVRSYTAAGAPVDPREPRRPLAHIRITIDRYEEALLSNLSFVARSTSKNVKCVDAVCWDDGVGASVKNLHSKINFMRSLILFLKLVP
jgi:hypothetical protein